MTEHSRSIPLRMWLVTLLVSLPAFLYGYVTAALNAAMITGDASSPSACFHNTDDEDPNCPPGTIYNDILLTTFEAQLATSLVVVGGWIGSLAGGPLSDLYGRRLITLANNWFFIIGAVLCSMANKWSLYGGRLIAGLGVGVECVVVPVLLAEIATAPTRGTITTVHQLLLTIGIFFVGVLGYGLVNYVSHGWIYIQAGSALPAVVMLLFSVTVPESPKWLIQKNRQEEARAVLQSLRHPSADVDEELREMTLEAEEGHGGSNKAIKKEEATWSEVFASRYQMLIGIGLGVIAAATGVNAIIFYSTQVFVFAGFSEAILATASVGAVNLLATALATYLVDVLGRKQLLEGGTALMTASLLLLALVLLVGNDLSEQLQGGLAVVAVLLYVVGFAIGIGAVMWVMMCEVMEQRVRSKAFGLFISINWGINFVIGLLTLSAIDALGGLNEDMDDDDAKSEAEKKGVAYLFVIFGCICFLSQVFIRFYVPETKGKTPADFVLCDECSLLNSLSSLRFQNNNIDIKAKSSNGEEDVDDPATMPDSAPLLS